MIWNTHSDLSGKHAPFSPSKYHWINYTDEKAIDIYCNLKAAEKGTADHAFAALCIERRQKLPKSRLTLNSYVNDAIGFRMSPEVVLKYSDLFFGTADAISFSERDNFLRIHDLKTGIIPAHMEQLEIYAALFCLEYGKNPRNLKFELRIYQNDEIVVEEPEPEKIEAIMDQIMHLDMLITKYRSEVE